MAIAGNLIANSLNQGISFAANIIAVPIYLSLLGVEQYGLIGFAIVVQTWVNLLELGMSGTLGREMTRLMIGDVGEASVLSFLRSLDWLFCGGIIFLPAIGWLSRGWWAKDWFAGATLDPRIIGQCVVLTIALAGVRLAATLYRGGLMGLERQVFVSSVSILGSLLRLVLPLPFVLAVPDVRIVLAAWLMVSLLELIVVRIALSRAFSERLSWNHFSIAELAHRASLWGSIAFLAVTWTAITQTDKLVLSRILPLADYGRFTMVMIVSNAILAIPGPIIFAFQPRMTAAATRGDRGELAGLVRSATRIMMILIVAPALALAAIPVQAIFAWTGDAATAHATAEYLGPYVVGSAIVGFASIIYAIQFAYGDLRLHVRALGLFAIVLVPSFFVAASRFGALGSAWLWLAVNLGLLIAYYPFVFHRFLPGEAKRWYGLVIAPPALASGAAALTIASVVKVDTAGRLLAIFSTIAAAAATCAAALLIGLLVAFRERQQSVEFAAR